MHAETIITTLPRREGSRDSLAEAYMKEIKGEMTHAAEEVEIAVAVEAIAAAAIATTIEGIRARVLRVAIMTEGETE